MTQPAEPSPPATIRTAVAADRPAVLALIDRLIAFGPPDHRDAQAMAALDREVMAAAIGDTQEGGAVFVVELDGRIAGVLHMTTLVDYYTRRANAHVATLIVDAELEGRGLGARLLAHAESWARARGDEWMTLTVFPQNTRAVAMYQRHGFRADMARYLKPLGPPGPPSRPPEG
jgi:GNAT superfamily N-acetyltransferase